MRTKMINLRRFSFLLTLVLLINTLCIFDVFGHESMLSVSYDECVPIVSQDGVDEAWYFLNGATTCLHFK